VISIWKKNIHKKNSNQRSNKHHIATDGRNAGLVNNNVLCYANTIFQIIASCGCLNESLSNNPMIFTNVFSERAPQFNNGQRNYLL